MTVSSVPSRHRSLIKKKYKLVSLLQYFVCLLPAICAANLRDPATILVKVEKRPIMYTFFQVKEMRDGTLDVDGGHDGMLKAWSEAWNDAGWDTVVLNMEDAKKHPDFQKYSDILMNMSKDSFVFGGGYNYMCLMRWLAMAAQRVDGWMCDYDTFPLHIIARYGLNLPYGGKFTVYDRFTPSLMSGSAKEWEKLAIKVVEQFLDKTRQEGTKKVYSDMYALEDVWKNSRSNYIPARQVIGFPYIEPNKVDCERTNRKLAFHISHDGTEHAKKDGLIPSTINGKHREIVYEQLMSDVKSQCPSQFALR